jgi:hypothetical protein
MDKDSNNPDSFEVSDDVRRKAEEFQKRKQKELSGLSPLALLARLRALLSDVTPEQAKRDREFLARKDDEKD